MDLCQIKEKEKEKIESKYSLDQVNLFLKNALSKKRATLYLSRQRNNIRGF